MKLVWDKTGERRFETGVDHGVLFPLINRAYPKGVAWNGLSTVTESPSGAEANPIYADNIKYLTLMSNEEFGATIEAYTYPDEFAECDGSAEIATGVSIGQQSRKAFGLSYRTLLGNDTEDTDLGYKIHLVYGAKASPSEKSRQTVNDSPEAVTFSWEVTTTPVEISALNPTTGKPYKPTSHLEFDSTKVDATKLAALEEILYGKDAEYFKTTDSSFDSDKTYYELVDGNYVVTSDVTMSSSKDYYELGEGVDPRMPLPDEVIKLFSSAG